MKKILYLLIIFIMGCSTTNEIRISDFTSVEASGTAPRLEREFKYSLIGSGLTFFDETDLTELIAELVETTTLSASKLVNSVYYSDKEALDFLFFDIYFDTNNLINYQNKISYRLRERFKSMSDFEEFIVEPKNNNWPYRLEFQAKVGREETDRGFSIVEESRFEFREESDPFDPIYNPPPAAPWDLIKFINYFKSGKFEDYYLWPTKALSDYLATIYPDRNSYSFAPYVVLVTERTRQHINMQTPWGTGPNPDQAFIISMDRTLAYPAEEFIKYMIIQQNDIPIKKPDQIMEFSEIEVEFERNVSEKLDEEIAKTINPSERQTLEQIRDAFIADQKLIMDKMTELLAQRTVKAFPINKSKYVQVVDLMKK